MPKRKSALIEEAELSKAAANVLQEMNLSQYAVADQLGVSQPAVSQAVNTDSPKLHSLRLRILREIGGKQIRGPLYEVLEK